jgi:hypothetical protein
MKFTIDCDFTPAALDQIEFGLVQTLQHLDGNAFPIRADAVQDALEIVCGLRSVIWQTHVTPFCTLCCTSCTSNWE